MYVCSEDVCTYTYVRTYILLIACARVCIKTLHFTILSSAGFFSQEDNYIRTYARRCVRTNVDVRTYVIICMCEHVCLLFQDSLETHTYMIGTHQISEIPTYVHEI